VSTPKDSIESSRSPQSPSQAASTEFPYAALGQGGGLYPAVAAKLEIATGNWLPLPMLPDSGASYTVLPRKYAVQLGFDLRDCVKIPVDTGNGHGFHWLAPEPVKAIIAGRELLLEPCFSDIGVAVLGRADFFAEFYVEVDERRRLVVITPHDARDAPAEPDGVPSP
jgi:hypothetical protein